jgi:hypothetical protein
MAAHKIQAELAPTRAVGKQRVAVADGFDRRGYRGVLAQHQRELGAWAADCSDIWPPWPRRPWLPAAPTPTCPPRDNTFKLIAATIRL